MFNWYLSYWGEFQGKKKKNTFLKMNLGYLIIIVVSYMCLCGESMRFKINICTVAQCLEVHTSFPLISILCWLDKECAAVRPEQSTSQFVSSNSANTENLSSKSRPRLIENEDRLPGAVLLARAKASGEVERGSSFCKQVSAYFDMQFGIFKGESGHYMKIIIYFMSSIICLCENCHYTSAQYQD